MPTKRKARPSPLLQEARHQRLSPSGRVVTTKRDGWRAVTGFQAVNASWGRISQTVLRYWFVMFCAVTMAR
jgi:hypothetical protein